LEEPKETNEGSEDNKELEMKDSTQGYLPKVITGDRSVMKVKVKENMAHDKKAEESTM